MNKALNLIRNANDPDYITIYYCSPLYNREGNNILKASGYIDLTSKNFFKLWKNMKRDFYLYRAELSHDTTENFYKYLKAISHGKNYLTVEEFKTLVLKTNYKGFYYAFDLLGVIEEVKICNKTLKIIDGTGATYYIKYNSDYKFYINCFRLVHHNQIVKSRHDFIF